MGCTTSLSDRSERRARWSPHIAVGPTHPELVGRASVEQHVYVVTEGSRTRLYIYWVGRLARIDHLLGTDLLQDLGFQAKYDGLEGHVPEREKWMQLVSTLGHRILGRDATWTCTLL